MQLNMSDLDATSTGPIVAIMPNAPFQRHFINAGLYIRASKPFHAAHSYSCYRAIAVEMFTIIRILAIRIFLVGRSRD